MHEVMNDNEIAIFFRNNHFSAVYKRNGQIWELVTDEGIVDADPRITWQSLSQLSGDEQFVSNRFNALSKNINQQQQLESYKNIQQKQEHNGNDQQPQNDEQKTEKTDDKDNANLEHRDSDLARKLALEDELGVSDRDFEQLQREQQQAMQQLEQQKMINQQQQNVSAVEASQQYPNQYQQRYNNQSHAPHAYANEYQQPNNNRRRKKKKKRKGSDDCVVL